MQIPISQAETQLTDLVRRAEAGEEIVLTRDGRPAVRLAPAQPRRTPEEKARALEEVWARCAAAEPSPGPSAARSQDFLYDHDGLPA